MRPFTALILSAVLLPLLPAAHTFAEVEILEGVALPPEAKGIGIVEGMDAVLAREATRHLQPGARRR